MVNKAEQPKEEPVQESTDNTTTDITEEFAGVDTPPEGTTDTLEAAPEVTEEATAPPAAETAGQQLPPPPPLNEPYEGGRAELDQRLQQLEQENSQQRQQAFEGQIQQAQQTMITELENNGYDKQTATQLAANWAAQESQVAKMQQESLQKERFLEGRNNAAEHFANKYNLQLADLAELRRYPDPQTMEAAAKRLQGDRSKDARIAELEAQLVPKQNFDDSQSTPAASNDEDRWLEKYNQGDRSPQASAAARRAAGLG